MKRTLSYTAGIIFLAMGSIASTVFAQTTANGPYYATPAWDQQLPASTRFIVLANWGSAAVLDRETGLVWEKAPNVVPRAWLNAHSHCLGKNVGGRKGWKLPSVQELTSLIDPAASNPALPAGHPFDLQVSSYWSSTTVGSGTTSAWVVSLFGGGDDDDPKSTTNLVWCVRGGSGIEAQ